MSMVLACEGAWAQAAPAAPDGAAAAPADRVESDAEALDAAFTGEIVVTARRRNELLQDVPIAVSAISGELAQRSGITNSEALIIATPSLDFSRQISQGATPFLRGVGSTQAASGNESPVAIYVDDVYISSPNANLFSLSNIASVQVLKGPQGTLFGRNATGGVIQVQTKRPSHDTAIEAQASYGNYDTVEGSFYGTTGLSETVAVNLALSGRKQHDGYGRSVTTGAETQLGWDWTARAQLLFEPSDTTRFLLNGDYQSSRSDYGSNSTLPPGAISASGATFAGAFNTQIADLDYARIRQGGGSLRIDHDAGFADLVSISAYRNTYLRFTLDQDGGPVPLIIVGPIITRAPTFTQELQIVSKEDSALKWIIGAYYMNNKTKAPGNRTGGIVTAPNLFVSRAVQQELNSIAAFGEATYEVLPATNLTLGVRYTRDSYDLNSIGVTTNTGFLIPNTTFRADQSFPKLTYRAIVDHKFTPDIMAYASYSRGFKSGGYNQTFPGTATNPAAVIRPEVLDAFEVGLKTKFFDGVLTLNGAAYYYDYKDLAVTLVQPGAAIIVNAASARIKGLDVDFIIAPYRGLRLSGGFGIIDGEYRDFPNGPIFLPAPATCAPPPRLLPGPRTGGNVPCTADLSGNTTARSPKFTLSLSPSYSFDTGIGEFTLAATYYHNSGFFWEANNRLTQPSYDVVNASIGWESTGKGFGVRAWARNLTDERFFSYAATDALHDRISYAPPRTYGATLIVRY